MASLPFWKFYTSDYLADTRHLSTMEHGAYFLLMLHYWQTGKPLPNDNIRLSRICGCSETEFAKMRLLIAEFFEVGETWVHHRIEKDIAEAEKEVSIKSKAGKKGAKARWNKRKLDNGKRNATANAGANATAMRPQCPSDVNIYTKPNGFDAPNDARIDWRTRLFRDGVQSVMRQTGKPEPQARALIGKWLKAYDDHAADVCQRIFAAESDQRADLIAWMQGGVRHKTTSTEQKRDRQRDYFKAAQERDAQEGRPNDPKRIDSQHPGDVRGRISISDDDDA